jgi:signal transduction histidine kinase
MADSGPTPPPEGRELSFVERLIYRAVAGSRTELLDARPEQLVRFDEPLVQSALSGSDAQHWGQDPDSALVRSSVAVPIEIQGRVRGAVVIEANSDGMLLVTNRALGRLLLSTLLLTFGLALGLWFFATRLSRRVQRLSSAVSEAMDETGKPGALPLTEDRDELGELARNNARLLKAVSNYTGYLQKLAGRLSHELKTPLAITRSSLDNLVSQELGEEAGRYVQRAREGLDRQAAIVGAMSEANRLEAAVASADWETVDLVAVLGHCVEAYRGVYPGREISFEYSESPCHWCCAPELVAQALDKLVENAVSLTGTEDEVRVTIDRNARECLIGVKNTGTRLPDVFPEQLFDSLVSLRQEGGGRHLGLGLHIVRLVAEAHGGKASARNLASGDGVEFTIHLVSG